MTDHTENEAKLIFNEFPGFAAHLISNIEEYVRNLVICSVEEEIPLLKLFSHLSTEELVAFGIQPHTEFLEMIVQNRAAEYMSASIKAYKEDKMKDLGRHDVLVEDITKGAFVRNKVFRKFFDSYTTDKNRIAVLIEETERFTSEINCESFKALMEIQMERVNGINEELSQTKQDLLDSQELAEMGSFVWDLVGDSSVFTPGVAKILGIREKVTTEDFLKRIHPDDVESTQQALDRAIKGNGDFECEYRYIINDEIKIVKARGIVSFENGKAVSMRGTLTDTTAKQQLLSELQESEELNKKAQSITHIGNWTWHVDSGVVNWSDEMYRIYGLEPQSEQITFERFIQLIHPDDREKRINEIQESLRTKKAEDYLLRIINPDNTLKILKGKGEAIVVNDKVAKLIGTCQDITKEFKLNEELLLKSSELEKLNNSLEIKNAQLELINKELESFNYVASHDLQEPLRKIQLFANRILETSSDQLTGNTIDYFSKILGSATRMRSLIDDLLKFSRTTSSDQRTEKVDLNTLMKEIFSSVSQTIEEKNAQFEIENLPEVSGTPFQLHQLFLNLIENSLKYTRQDVPPLIRITARETNHDHSMGNVHFHEISIADNGIGFEPENAKDIFGLFKRLHQKQDYYGTGIGLAICKKIIDNHNGLIYANGNPGVGAEFIVCLPVLKSKETTTQDLESATPVIS